MIRWTLALALLTVGCGQPSDGEVAIKGGTYIPGNDAFYPEEARGGPVAVADFSIDRHEVTNRQFTEFVKATGYVTQAERGFPDRPDIPPEQRVPGGAVFLLPAPGRNPGWTFMPGANWRHPDGPDSDIEGQDDIPVVQVTVVDALAYARWKGRDLPTEAEWEWAARSGRTLPGRERPVDGGGKPAGNNWDGVFPVKNEATDGFVGRAPVASFPADGRGIHDMTGNVWELTSSPWTSSHKTGAQSNPQARVIKGGSFLCARNFCARYRPQSRQMQEGDMGTNHVGFRTVKRRK